MNEMSINFRNQEVKDRNIDELIGICRGVLSDGEVNQSESNFLIDWIESHFSSIDISAYPISTIYDRLVKVLSDGVLDENEAKELKELLESFVGDIPISEQISSMSSSLPLCSPAPNVSFEGKIFCLTGAFTIGTRKTVENMIIDFGGEIKKAPSLKTNYLVIGILGSEDWIHSSFGRKIEKAVEIRDTRNKEISIISEEHFIKFV